MAYPTRRSRTLGSTLPAILASALALALGAPPRAQAGEWTLSLQPLYLTISGHDPHVLTVHEIDRDAGSVQDEKRAVLLETGNGPAYRGELEYDTGRWTWGFDVFWFSTTQKAADRSASAGGAIDEVVFEVADRSFTSTGPGEVLFYRRLEDTDVALWTADLRATRTLAETADTGIDLVLGLRVGDFDNDYRAVVGIEGVGGRRLDASSNYGRMTGPLVGLTGTVRRGRNTLEGHLAQSALFGDVELTSRAREFSGPFVETEELAFTRVEVFRADQDVTIPITEARIRWTYQATEHLSLGAGIDTSAWWDVPVPPGIAPIEDGQEALHENTLVFAGALAIVEWRF